MSLSMPTPESPGDTLRGVGVRPMTVATFLRLHVFPSQGGVEGVSKKTGLRVSTLNEVVSGERRVDEHLAARLARLYPSTSTEFWLNLQANAD